MLRHKKSSYKEFDNEKRFLRLENSPLPPHNFSNGPAHKALYNATLASKRNRCLIRFNKPILWFTFAINDSICSFQVRFLWMTTPRYLTASSLSRFSWSMTSSMPWQVCNLLSPPNNTNFDFDVFKARWLLLNHSARLTRSAFRWYSIFWQQFALKSNHCVVCIYDYLAML